MKKLVLSLLCCLAAALFTACGPQEPPRIAVTGIALDQVTVSLTEGGSVALVATVTPEDASDKSVSWSSSNEAVATVTDAGVVNGLHAGTAVIVATTTDGGKTATCNVTVNSLTSAMTGEATHISCRNAVLSGSLNMPGRTADDLVFGVLYSLDDRLILGVAEYDLSDSFDENQRFSISTKTLEPDTLYYYRSFVSSKLEDKSYYGEVKTFRTLPVSTMIQTGEATDVETTLAQLHATLDLTDCRYESLTYGFRITPEGGSTSTITASNLTGTAYSLNVKSLKRNTQYSAVAYVTLDNRTYTGEEVLFDTKSITAGVSLNEVDASEFSATVSGSLNIESQGSLSKSAELYYSDSVASAEELRSCTAYSLSITSDGSFSRQISVVTGTTYYYLVVATVDGATFESEVKRFEAAQLQLTVDAKNLGEENSLFLGSLSATSSLITEVGFLYSTTLSSAANLLAMGDKISAEVKGNMISANVSGLQSGRSYYYIAFARVQDRLFPSEVKFFTKRDIVDLPEGTVDMGLSVKWASCNIGASKPEDYGDYYAWGETTTKSTYNWPTYTLCGGSENTLTKYCTGSSFGTVDSKTVLDPEDDVAHVKLGGKWRMPTDAEWTELRKTNNCDWVWTTINGVNGMLVTSKKTGNSIFLPAGGFRHGDMLFNAGSYGRYWSSSLITDRPYDALVVYFNSDNVTRGSNSRFCGRSVRPVSE